MKAVFARYRVSAVVVAAVMLLVVGGLWWRSVHSRPKVVYTSEGYGGYTTVSPKDGKSQDPLNPAISAYNAGRYKEAERAASGIIRRDGKSDKPEARKNAVRAQYVLAFSAAGRKDMKLARDRFAVLRTVAAKLPDKGAQEPIPGQTQPTLEEQGAYQHAVCTAALGDKKAAQAEYIKFMLDFPESPLINGASMRIERLNGGKLPPEAEAAFAKAKQIALDRDEARRVEEAMCGPECLAELLRRRGEKVDVRKLAKEMETSEEGTTLQALADAAEKHGYSAKGLSVTWKGLKQQPLPLIGMIGAGHYVIVDKINLLGVTVWDPNGKGIGKPSTRHFSAKQWQKLSPGVSLVLKPKPAGKSE